MKHNNLFNNNPKTKTKRKTKLYSMIIQNEKTNFIQEKSKNTTQTLFKTNQNEAKCKGFQTNKYN